MPFSDIYCPLPSVLLGEVRFSLLPNFQRGGLLGMRGLMFFRGSCGLYIENKLKSEIFNDEKHFKQEFKQGKFNQEFSYF